MSANPTALEEARARVGLGLNAIVEGLASLSNLEMVAHLDDRLPSDSPLGDLDGPLRWAETHVVGAPDRRVGLILQETLALRISAGMLMMPQPDEMNEELSMAFDEAINVAIGLWNPVVADGAWRWDNSVNARKIQPTTPAQALTDCAVGRLGLVLAHVDVAGRRYPVAVFGHVPWSDEVMRVPTPAEATPVGQETRFHIEGALKPRPASRSAARPASRQAPRPEAPPAPRSRREARPEPVTPHDVEDHHLDALLVFVDRTGALKAWLLQQLQNPEFVFTKTNEPINHQAGARAIVLVEPTDHLHAAIRAGRTIVMQKA